MQSVIEFTEAKAEVHHIVLREDRVDGDLTLEQIVAPVNLHAMVMQQQDQQRLSSTRSSPFAGQCHR